MAIRLRHCTLISLAVLTFFATSSAFAATFVVPPDRELIRRADAIVIAIPLASYTQLNDEGGIETITPIRVEEVLKGEGIADALTVVEPGGEYHGRAEIIPGIPRFNASERLLLFLSRVGPERWAVTEIVLGKYAFRSGRGTMLLLRDTNDIAGWDPDLTPHRERTRDAERFLQFIRTESRGGMGKEDYFVRGPAITANDTAPAPRVTPNIAPYTATSYTMFISGSQGGRWAVFPSPVSFFSGTTQEPGAPGGGSTAITTAFTSWNNDCGSNVNYVYAGMDNGTHTQGLHAPDGANTILFERDLSTWGVGPFTCSGNSYSGTLGIGGITNASGTNVVNGETFSTTQEGDVEMNRGIANCTLLFNNGDWNSAVTHEVGHTLGFRHSDQTRDSAAGCSSDPSLECSAQAIMRSSIPNGLNAALQAWDQHAVQAVYPGNICAPGCTVPAITSQPQSVTISSGQSVTLSVGASGTAPLLYQWYIGASGNTTSPIPGATGSSVQVSPTTTTTYWVRVSNACGAADSTSATVTVTVPPPPPSAALLYLVTPCRIFDSRNPYGTYGGPILASGTSRNVPVAGLCGIPAGATAISVNVAAYLPSSAGYITLYPGPASNPVPYVSTLNYRAGRTLANNAIVRVLADSVNIFNAGPDVHVFIDVNGYFK
jgi:hypothetical protein